MRRVLVLVILGCFLLAALPADTSAGDTHAVRNRWAGVAIGAGAVVAGSMLLSAFGTPVHAVAAPPPPVVYAPPPMIVYYAPPPVVYAPPVMYAPGPVVVYEKYGGGHAKGHHKHWKHHRARHGHHH